VVLRLYDPEAGEARPLALAHPRLLGLRVRGGLRAYVVGDLVRRLAEHRKLRVWLDTDGAPPELNVHPGRGASPAGLDLDVVSGDAQADPAAGRRLRVAGLAGDPGLARDPLAVRLLVLRTPYRQVLELDRPTLAAADALLVDWRKAVASWAESPSAPMPPAAVAAVVGALEDDLDSPAALAALDRFVADPAVPDGAKFECLAYLDLVLGLDLARDVGLAQS
jgi:hypothetical protein